jgi:hypothetical protein
MKLADTTLVAAALVAAAFAARAQTPPRGAPHEERRDDRGVRPPERREGHGAPREMRRPEPLPPRSAPVWRAHPAGPHPATPGYHPAFHPHAVRVLRPHVIRGSERPWHHWEHPDFVRPLYYWDWPLVRAVTCTAEDSYGDQYPVTESTFSGFGLVNMTGVEDDALDRCYADSGGDPGCQLVSCMPAD